MVQRLAPKPVQSLPLTEGRDFHVNLDADNDAEVANRVAVSQHMREIMRIPVVEAGAVMPDACPAGAQLGTIPVGGVVKSKAIHPGMHSADVCCSMAISIIRGVEPKDVLDAGSKITHFGPGGRPRGDQWTPPYFVMDEFASNNFLKPLVRIAQDFFGTQGDGNHFFYVGTLASTGETAIVTHHGSRGPGAALYKDGLRAAQRYTKTLTSEVAPHNAWLDISTEEGEEYWRALQAVRLWTKENHYAIHEAVATFVKAPVVGRFWNEHNFVFERDGHFFHAKGATPAFRGFSADDIGLTLIPLNMAQPILITRGLDAPNGLGFSPHGAGRNYSRTHYMRENAHLTLEQMMAQQTQGLDVRFYSGRPDASELPGAYKDANKVRAQIDKYGLCAVIDIVQPYGCIMAGAYYEPWRNKKKVDNGTL